MLKVNIMVMFTSYHLWSWYTNNKICGYCGGKTVTDYNERALFCKNCCRVIYPRINPAVIVGVINGDKLLVTRYAKDRGVSYDALVAGFTEIGETFEQTVAREVHEEVGLKVKNIRYYKSQPWGYSGGILAGFYCDLDESEEITIDKTELSCAEWRTRDEITGQPDDLSLTNEMMMHFKNNMK
ncbi:MAG TPA: NAD(+) diphosphatase [Ruminococcus flavefaciens]|nr:NAD(+) diphosphatase [Ruminococcus flavefaciens]